MILAHFHTDFQHFFLCWNPPFEHAAGTIAFARSQIPGRYLKAMCYSIGAVRTCVPVGCGFQEEQDHYYYLGDHRLSPAGCRPGVGMLCVFLVLIFVAPKRKVEHS